METNLILPDEMPHPPEELHRSGREFFHSLVTEFPLPFHVGRGFRATLRNLPRFATAFPRMPRGPWNMNQWIDEGDILEIGYRAEEWMVDFYLGFFEALADYFGECIFILSQTLRHQVKLRVVFA